MTPSVKLVRPSRCFCAIPEDAVRPWIVRRYVEQRPTLELLRSTNSAEEKAIITMVALLDLDDRTVLNLMRNAGQTDDHVLACRRRVKRLWRRLATPSPDRPAGVSRMASPAGPELSDGAPGRIRPDQTGSFPAAG